MLWPGVRRSPLPQLLTSSLPAARHKPASLPSVIWVPACLSPKVSLFMSSTRSWDLISGSPSASQGLRWSRHATRFWAERVHNVLSTGGKVVDHGPIREKDEFPLCLNGRAAKPGFGTALFVSNLIGPSPLASLIFCVCVAVSPIGLHLLSRLQIFPRLRDSARCWEVFPLLSCAVLSAPACSKAKHTCHGIIFVVGATEV